MNIAIIPARGGSTRIPGKNKRLFHGKPIIAYSIETAKASKLFDEIIVSTDDQKIVTIAKAYGAKVHMRPAYYCRDDIGTQEVVKIALRWWLICHPNRRPANVCCIYPTAPLMIPQDLRQGFDTLQDARWHYVHTADMRQKDAGQWYWGRASAFLDGVPLDGNSCLQTLPERRVMDINTEADWQRAEKMFAELRINGIDTSFHKEKT